MDEFSKLKLFSSSYEQTPSFGVWNGIQTQLDALQKRRRRIFLWLWFGGLSLIGVIGWLGWHGQTSKNKIVRGPENTSLTTGSSSVQSTSHVNVNHAAIPNAVRKNRIGLKNNPANDQQYTKADYKQVKGSALKTEQDENKSKKQSMDALFVLHAPTDGGSYQNDYQLTLMASILSYLPEQLPKMRIDTMRSFPHPSNKYLSRWSVRLSAGRELINYTGTYKSSEGTLSDHKFQVSCYGAELAYDYNPRVKIWVGIKFRTTGMETGRSQVILKDPLLQGPVESLYSIPTSAGTLTGTASQFDRIYFNSKDSSLFESNSPLVGAPFDSVKTRDFTLRSEFHYLSVPFHFEIHPFEKKFTPYISAGLAAEYLLSERQLLNKQNFQYEYESPLKKWQFSLDVSAGIRFRFSNRINFDLSADYRHGTRSISRENKWIPRSFGIDGGLSWRFNHGITTNKF